MRRLSRTFVEIRAMVAKVAPNGRIVSSGRVLPNDLRLRRLATDAIRTFSLDLTGLRVVTEAASGAYVVTPLLAALAGAHVTAITSDSRHARAEDVIRRTRELATLWGVPVDVTTDRRPARFADADIVTNLGFVRPIDRAIVNALPPNAVIPLMFEPWEVRTEDVDLVACRERGILIMGTDESHPWLRTFDHVGMVCVKLVLELDVEVVRSRIVVLGGDGFADAAARMLSRVGAIVARVDPAGPETDELPRELDLADCLLFADGSDRELLGPHGVLRGEDLAQRPLRVVHLIGNVDASDLEKSGVTYLPRSIARPGHMSVATEHIGPRPVVELHAAGLKVGQEMHAARRLGLPPASCTDFVVSRAPALPLTERPATLQGGT